MQFYLIQNTVPLYYKFTDSRSTCVQENPSPPPPHPLLVSPLADNRLRESEQCLNCYSPHALLYLKQTGSCGQFCVKRNPSPPPPIADLSFLSPTSHSPTSWEKVSDLSQPLFFLRLANIQLRAIKEYITIFCPRLLRWHPCKVRKQIWGYKHSRVGTPSPHQTWGWRVEPFSRPSCRKKMWLLYLWDLLDLHQLIKLA